MFVLCPHCHFLVGLDPRTGAPPPACPKCNRSLVEAGNDAVAPVDLTGPAATAAAYPSGIPVPANVDPPATDLPAPDTKPQATPAADDSTPASPPVASRLDAEAVITAMAGKAPRRSAGARRKSDDAAPSPPVKHPAPAAPTTPPRTPRAKRKTPPAPAPETKPATAPAQPSAPQRSIPWWQRLLQVLQARRTKLGTHRAAASATTPADPLAASVRNRARARRAAGTQDADAPSPAEAMHAAEPVNAPAIAAKPARETPAEPVAAADPVAAPIASSAASVAATAATALPASAAPAAPASPAERVDAAATMQAAASGTASTSATDGHAVVADATVATQSPAVPATPDTTPPAASPPETPFVERRRNPDIPIPLGTIPPHPLRRRTDAVTPSFAVARPKVAPAHSWRWTAAVAALVIILVLQLLLAQRDTLARDARWRPMLSAICTVVRCQLPSWHEPTAFTMLSRDVRAHPAAPGTLLINASFRNDARWPQPWPRVLLTLSNADGRIVGARAFAAKEYLASDAGTETATLQHELAPGQTAAITLAVVEPAPDIVAFSFDFR